MDTSYRLGVTIVLGTILTAAGLSLAKVDPAPGTARAGQDLGAHGFDLGAFRLTERSGRVVTESDLADRVWVASFIFTHCPLSCPRITSLMAGLQTKLAGTTVRFVSLSVDPDRDTPEALADYARRYGADRDRWWFLTGPKDEILPLIRERFKQGVEPSTSADQGQGAEAILHSDRLALVDRGNRVIGFFDSSDPGAVRDLIARATQRDKLAQIRDVPPRVRKLPAVNALLNTFCSILLVLGWTMIRARWVRGHAVCMASCVLLSAIFLTCYLIYHFQVGSMPFPGVGPVRVVYYTILLSHLVLAIVLVPLVAVTLTRALRRRFDRHARIARLTLPIWLYVSTTGVVIYAMLYQWPGMTHP